jgi:glucokinase
MMDIIATVDIGATKTTASLCTREGIIIRVYQKTKLEGPEDTIPRQVKELIDACFIRSGLGTEGLKAVGISTAGPFQKLDGYLHLVSPNICGGMAPERGILPNEWKLVPLERVLSDHYDNIVIQNDAVSGVVAESIFGSGKGLDNLLYATWSTGIGTGALVDGRLIKGKNGNAPHGGHVFLVDGGPRCGCGDDGHLEALSSGTAIARDYGGGASTAEVFGSYHKGDEKAIRIINEASRHFARGLASINNILDTEMIIIGGSVFLNNVDVLLPLVKEEFYRSFPTLSREVQIVPTTLGEHLGDLAALSLVIQNDWIDPWKIKRPWERAPETIVLD